MSRNPEITVPTEREEYHWRNIVLIIALLALMIIVAYGVVTITAPEVITDTFIGEGSISTVENPELNLFLRYKAAAEARAEMVFLANNPEIMLLQRYAAGQAGRQEATFLSTNPEIMSARRYAATIGQFADDRFLARNPEVMLFRRFARD